VQRPCPHRCKIGEIDPQQFACDEIGRIVRQIVNTRDDRVGGNHQLPPAAAIDECGVIEQTQSTGPGERRIEPPDALKFIHGYQNASGRSVRASRSRTPFASAGSRPVKNA